MTKCLCFLRIIPGSFYEEIINFLGMCSFNYGFSKMVYGWISFRFLGNKRRNIQGNSNCRRYAGIRDSDTNNLGRKICQWYRNPIAWFAPIYLITWDISFA